MPYNGYDFSDNLSHSARTKRIRANVDELRRRVSPETFSAHAAWARAHLDDRQAIEEYTIQELDLLDGHAQAQDYNDLRHGG